VELVLHIGRHKTGTTAIQWHLARIGHPGLCYPEAGRTRDAATSHIAHHTIPALIKRQDPHAESDRLRLADHIAEEVAGSPVVVLSSEYFETLPDGAMPALARFVRRIKADRVTTVYFAREQLDYLASRFQQSVIQGSKEHDFADFARRHIEPDLPALVERWRSIGHVQVRLYDRELLLGGDVVTEFIATTGLRSRPSRPVRDANLSISGNLLVAKAVLNAMGEQPVPQPAALRRLASTEPRFRGRFRVPQGFSEAFRAQSRFNSDLRAIVGDVPLRALWDAPPVPDVPRLTMDLARIQSELGLARQQLAAVRTNLSAVRRWFMADQA
jgi:hypothetical protein